MKIFYGLVHKENDSAFGITFPDAPGCFSAADEESDLLTNAQEALSLFVEGATVPDDASDWRICCATRPWPKRSQQARFCSQCR